MLILGTVFLQNACKSQGQSWPYGQDQDGDGWPSQFDCDDENDSIFPGADEIVGDGIDQDCSGSDAAKMGGEGGQLTEVCLDPDCIEADPQGGTPGAIELGKDADRDGYTEASGDCDDDDPFVHPGAFDRPGDGLDQNCDGADSADQDGDGVDGYPDGADCDDTRAEVFPGAAEIVLNGIDENCDGSDLAGTEESWAILSEDAVVGEAPDICAVEIDGSPYLFVVWADSRTAVRQDIYAQLLTLDGDAVGPEMPISVDTVEAKSNVKVVSAGDAILVVWSSASGVYTQQLDAEGVHVGIAFGIADPGALDPVPAVGAWKHQNGASWAIAWRRPGDEPGSQGQLRTMSMEAEAVRSPIENLGDPQEIIGATSVVGTPTGFLTAWSGVAGEERGLWTQQYTRTGNAQGPAQRVHDDAPGSIALARSENHAALSFRSAGSFGYAAGLMLSFEGELAESGSPLRLSAESPFQTNFRSVYTPTGFVTVWQDDRHMNHVPSIEAVYGNVGWAKPNQVVSRALYADVSAVLGGVTTASNRHFAVLKAGNSAQLLEFE